MVLEWLSHYWNDILTIILAASTLLIGYYQIKHYRAQFADVKITDIQNAEYLEVNWDLEKDNPQLSYSMDVFVWNDGRDPATISEAKLILADADKKLQLTSKTNNGGNIRLSGNDRKEISYEISTEPWENHPDEISGRVRLDTTSGPAEVPVKFSPP